MLWAGVFSQFPGYSVSLYSSWRESSGVDSVELPREKKEAIWQLLAGQWQPDGLEKMTTEVCLAELPEYIESIFKGKQVGRVVVNVQEI